MRFAGEWHPRYHICGPRGAALSGSRLSARHARRAATAATHTRTCRGRRAIPTATKNHRIRIFPSRPWPFGAPRSACYRYRTSTSSSLIASRTIGATRSAGRTRCGTTYPSTTASLKCHGGPTGPVRAPTGRCTHRLSTCLKTARCCVVAKGLDSRKARRIT